MRALRIATVRQPATRWCRRESPPKWPAIRGLPTGASGRIVRSFSPRRNPPRAAPTMAASKRTHPAASAGALGRSAPIAATPHRIYQSKATGCRGRSAGSATRPTSRRRLEPKPRDAMRRPSAREQVSTRSENIRRTRLVSLLASRLRRRVPGDGASISGHAGACAFAPEPHYLSRLRRNCAHIMDRVASGAQRRPLC